ncbi:MAG TPA: amino acid adenylation domain-containing protein [Thermoanaerobaculia bacterium]|jgi:amino acid adenylation domain-containing protein|nr:amino acid adenylation domain-containing protein [Thermoanaerobaculia bacterium]
MGAGEGFRLSPQQELLWLAGGTAPGRCAQAVLHVEKHLAAAVARAARELAAEVEILRTTFAVPPGGGLPLQVIHDELPPDWRTEVSEDTPEKIDELLRHERSVPFDLERGPLVRFVWVPDAERALLAVTMPALLADLGTLANLGDALLRRAAGRPAEESLQYCDYSEWQHQLVETSGEAADNWRRHWRKELEGSGAPLPWPGHDTAETGCVSLPLDLEGIGALAAAEQVAPADVLLTAWAALLWRCAGREPVLVGRLRDGRSHAELAGALGPFTRWLPWRFAPEEGWTFRGLLRRLPSSTAEHLQQAGLLAHLAGKAGELAGVSLDFEDDPWPAANVVRRHVLAFPGPAKLVFVQAGGRADLWFDRLRLGEDGASRLAEGLAAALRSALADPDLRLDRLPVLGEAGGRFVAEQERGPSAEVTGSSGSLLPAIESHARQRPGDLAVVDESGSATWRELNARANRVAHWLLARGLAPESCVAVTLERSADAVAALLGVWKAGCAYVPLDPRLPAARIDAALAISGAAAVIDAGVIAGLGDLPEGDPGLVPDSCQLAYVVFTSGSTGEPKGVAVTHVGLGSYVRSVSGRLGWTSRPRRFALVSTLAADLGNTSVFGALATGGCLCIASPETAMDGRRLASFLRGNQVDVLKIVPSHLRALLAEAGGPLPLEQVVSGGEALTPELAAEAACAVPGGRLVNHYGPTEATVGCALGEVAGAVTIGRPTAATALRVLDAGLERVPLGVPGELCVAGPQVARGYLGRPDLTAERFVPDPFAEEPGGRLYRTGDRARHRPDGRLELLGRFDDQVKLRGYRVEPAEVRAVLAAHPEVEQAVVALDPRSAEPALAAYVVPADGQAPAAAALRSWLRDRLPDAMVPARFYLLRALPLTPNGKLDRGALEKVSAPLPETGFVPPRTPMEEMVADLWAGLLRRESPVGATENFFDLGGHSLIATQVVARVRELSGAEVVLADLFEAPTVAGFADRIERAVRSRAGTAEPPPPLVRRGGPPRLSFAQERLWFLAQLAPEAGAYNSHGAFRLRGPLDADALGRALGEIVRCHEVLRTAIRAVNGAPVPVVVPEAACRLRVQDLSLPEARRRIADEALLPFDLETAPLLRADLYRLADDDHVLAVTMHHIVSDGWSVGVLARELGELYASRRLAPLPFQYADWAAWQREWMEGDVLRFQLGFWRGALAGAPALDLPLDAPRPAVQRFDGAELRAQLPPEARDALRRLGRSEGATLFMTLLAAFQVLLARWTGAWDVTIGAPVAGRNRVELEGLIGLFVNMLALRGRLAPGMTVPDLLAHVRKTCLAAWAHQDVPFEKVVAELQPERDLSRNPLFQVSFELREAGGSLELEGLDAEPLALEVRRTRFDLELRAFDGPGGLELSWVYNTGLLSRATVERMAGHFNNLLLALPGPLPLGELPMMGEEERRAVEGWGLSPKDFPGTERVHDLFERQAARTPDAVALVGDDGREVSFAELSRESNRAARFLARQGAGPDVPVGLLMDRSVDRMTALLGVLKAGSAYVPLDPEHPAERLAFVVRDAGIPLVLADRPFDLPGTRVIVLPRERGRIAAEPDGEPALTGALDNLAYVLYTSGSTGRPKGVMVSHRALRNHMLWMAETFDFTAADVVLQKTPLTFDASVWELFLTLIIGGKLALARPRGHQDPEHLAEAVERHGATVLQVVPTLLRMLVEVPSFKAGPLRHLFVGGEALASDLAAAAGERLGVRVHNLYGPTEATIDATFWTFDGSSVGAEPIGCPVANVETRVLDAARNLAPAGVVGEIFLGGPGLARGYLRRPDLTAERFVPDPLGRGARLYRTGDLGRWRPDGVLEFLGRMDEQVKVRGHRVEPGEIESALREVERVREAAVQVRDGRLVAWVVDGASPGELRRALEARLPDYMVPAAFVSLDGLPRTASGKLDRRALPDPGPERPALEQAYTGPRTASERLLAGIWQDVLGLDQVGVHDSFFEVGGDSMLALRVLRRLRDHGVTDVVMVDLFQYPTIAALAERIDDRAAAAPRFEAVDRRVERRRQGAARRARQGSS